MTVRELLAGTEERFLVPAIVSPRRRGWVALHRGVTLPFFLRGPAVRWELSTQQGLLRLLGVGPRKRLEPLERLLGSLPSGAPATAPSRWNSDRYQRDPADLIAVAIHPAAAPRFRRAGWVIVPDVVRWIGRLAEVPPPTPSRSLRSDLHRIARFGGETEEAGSPADWNEFFTAMVEPQAEGRFGESAWIPRPPFRAAMIRRGRLLFLRRQGQRVAGMVLLPCGDGRAWVPLIAIRGGDPELLAAGAAVAAIFAAMDWARRHGFTTVDAGRTSSSTRDGVHVTKVKWGLRPVPDPLAHLLALRISPDSAPLRAALAERPPLIDTGAELIPLPVGAPAAASIPAGVA